MKLKAMTVNNFRQFYGEQSLYFDTSEDRNVTLVYGANGAGKTTLLNAFTWALYKKFTPAFENEGHLINERAWSESKPGREVSASVRLEFEHESRTYFIERLTVCRKGNGNERQLLRDAELKVDYRDEGGRENKERENPGDTVNQILPDRLHRFFFFDGERIEQLAKKEAYAEIADAIKNVLGLEIIERALKHTSGAIRKLESELKAVAPPELAQLQEELDNERSKKEEAEKERSNLEQQILAADKDLEAVNARLRTLEEAKKNQERLEGLETQYAATKEDIRTRREQLVSLMSQRGYVLFTEAMATKSLSVLQALRQKGEIPSALKRQFVEDLLERGECICGTKLVPGQPPHASLQSWRSKSGNSEVEDAWTRLSAQAEEFLRSRQQTSRDVQDRLNDIGRFRKAQLTLEEQISEVKRLFKKSESEEVSKLDDCRESLKAKRDDYRLKLGWNLRDIQSSESRIKELEKSLQQAELQSEKARVAQRRVAAAVEARNLFAQILDLRTEDVRLQLDERVKKIYARISFKPYTPALTDQFRLELKKPVGSETEAVAKGTGENQILSLAFVGAIADLARQRYQEVQDDPAKASQVLSFQGGIYPMVMDSPFGSLDENYRTLIAEAIPQLSPQVVVFVSKSQGLGVVSDALAPRVGRRYVISYHTPKNDADAEQIELASRTFPYIVKAGDGWEWAEVKEVS